MAAFDHAYSLGIRVMETDVHLSRDGVVVAFHDPEIDRVSGQTGRIDEMTFDELRAVELGSSRIPSMAELLETFADCVFNIDAKSDEVLTRLLAVIEECRAADRVCVGSFSERRLRRARATHPHIATSAGPLGIGLAVLRSLKIPVPPPADVIAYQVPQALVAGPIGQRFVDQAHADGRVVHAWTVNDEDVMEQLLDRGVDGIMTDRPSTVLEVIARRSC